MARAPHSHTVLVAVTGMSPAVLTETVWGLAFPAERGTPRVVPDRVIALTTSAGREAIAGQLFGPDAVWDSLREAVLGRGHKTDPRLCFGVTGDAVKVFTIQAGGKPSELSDISTEAENIAVADFITDELWGHVEKPGTRLIASISGGFKTMSALLFAGMSLLGRNDDLITHVLVGAPYDTGVLSPRFFFPAQPCQELKGRDGGVWLARDAQLRLGFVPFVPLHDLLEKYRKPRSYSDLVARCKSRLDRQRREPVRLRLSVAKRQVRVNDTVLTLPAQAFLFLWFLAERARSAQAPLGKYLEALRPFQDFAREVQRRWTQLGVGWAAEGKRILPTDFDEAVAKSDDAPVRTRLLYGITERLRRVPGAAPLAAYLPQSGRCTLDLAPKSITIDVPDVP
jgi:CRISPR-associated protein (TIGR02584 family)